VSRVLICDDHELFREGIKAILRGDPALQVVGEARTGREAVEQARRLRPELVLMDMEMPQLSGLEATRRIVGADPRVRVLILTMYAEEELVARCMEAGAAGYLLKDAPSSQLLYALGALARGERYMSPAVVGNLVDRMVSGLPPTRTRYESLTQREREVLRLLAEGHSLKEVAARLGVTAKTADAHKTSLMRKLDLHDRTQLVKYAIQNKLIRLPVME
jgi:two-component system response regulator NreC